ncbi:MAG: CD3324 family protein [Roseburia sp.]
MSYVNAKDVLPKMLVEEIQKYVDGQLLYIPRKNGSSLSWGEKNGTKEKMAERNQTILNRYALGQTVAELSREFYLSEKRILGIIHEYESSNKEKDGGFQNE